MPSVTTKFPTPAFHLADHPASLPEANIPDSTDHAAIAASTITSLSNLTLDHLTDNAIWRDTQALCGTYRTFFRPKLVQQVWSERCRKQHASNFTLRAGSSMVMRVGPNASWIEAGFVFDREGQWPAQCSGTFGLVPSEQADGTLQWKIWLITTVLEQVRGWPDVEDLRPLAAPTRDDEAVGPEGFPVHVDCLVAGGSGSGLCMAGRLQALELSYLVVERNADVGHTWLKDRYESLKLHTSRDYVQLPGRKRFFTPDQPANLTSGQLVDGFRMYIEEYGIKIKYSTRLEAAEWQPSQRRWAVKLRHGDDTISMTASHVVLAVGGDGVRPSLPSLPNRDRFGGTILHGSEWRNGKAYTEKSGIIVGSANTALGIMADMGESRLHPITMIQRSKTFLLPYATFSGLVDPVYNAEIPTAQSDRMSWGYPLPIQRLMAMNGIRALADQNAAYFDRIEANGFDGDRYGDLWGTMYSREGGHFFDTGAGELIANGTVKVRSKVHPVEYTETGLRLSDGTTVDGEVIVFATGYTANMRASAIEIFGKEVGESLQEFWWTDIEGELRGGWKPIGHPGIWYTGHGIAHARYFSRFVAMHIKADLTGNPFEVYDHTPAVE